MYIIYARAVRPQNHMHTHTLNISHLFTHSHPHSPPTQSPPHTLLHLLIYSLAHPLTHPLTHTPLHSLVPHSLTPSQLYYTSEELTTAYKEMGLFTSYIIHSPGKKSLAERAVSQFIETYCNFFMFLIAEKLDLTIYVFVYNVT